MWGCRSWSRTVMLSSLMFKNLCKEFGMRRLLLCRDDVETDWSTDLSVPLMWRSFLSSTVTSWSVSVLKTEKMSYASTRFISTASEHLDGDELTISIRGEGRSKGRTNSEIVHFATCLCPLPPSRAFLSPEWCSRLRPTLPRRKSTKRTQIHSPAPTRDSSTNSSSLRHSSPPTPSRLRLRST